MTKEEIDAIVAEREASQERIWQIVNKLSYEEFRAMQRMLAPVEDEE